MNTLRQTRLATAPVIQFRPLAWIIRLNAAFREQARMKALTDGELRDLGLTRHQARQTRIMDILSRAPRY